MTIHVESTSDTKEQVLAAIGGKAPVKEEKSEAAPAKAEEQAEIPDESEASEKEPEENDGESKDEPKEKPLKGVEKRISKLVKQRDAARQEAEALKAEKVKAQPAEVKAAPVVNSSKEPDPDDFSDHKDYLKAQVRWELAEEKKQEEAAKKEAEVKTQRQKAVDSYNSKLETVQEKYPDYDDVIEESEIEAPGHILSALFESENGPELTYLLAKNEEELKRISKLSPASALLELGKFEAKHISGAPEESEEPKLTKAPAPIKPVGSKGSSSSQKKPDEMSYQEFKRWRAKQV